MKTEKFKTISAFILSWIVKTISFFAMFYLFLLFISVIRFGCPSIIGLMVGGISIIWLILLGVFYLISNKNNKKEHK
jgi:hypothetical protein